MKKIVIIDDERLNLVLAQRILSKKYEISAFLSPLEAIEFLKRNSDSVNLVLLDVLMPEMSGFEVMETLQNGKDLKNIPVIFLTADDSEETKIKCEKSGAKCCVAKPFVAGRLLQVISEICA